MLEERLDFMKRKILIISAGILLLSTTVFFTYLKIFKVQTQSTGANNSNELTSVQKKADFRYLTNLVVKAWPFVEADSKIEGLSDISTLSEEYIQMAGETKSDTEFMQLIEEYVTRLSQTGHAYLLHEDPIATQLLAMSEDEKNNIRQTLSFYNIDESALDKINYWYWMADKIVKSKFIQPEIKITYTNGKYIVTEECKFKSSGKVLQKDAEIENINGYPVDEYVKILQTKSILGYDNNLSKLFIFNPLMVKSHNDDSEWKVSFKLPNNHIEDTIVLQANQSTSYTSYPNVITEDLREDIGYIKIFSFIAENKEKDKKLINDYINKSQNKYKKLIIDIRGNGGGDPEYWKNLIIAPLIREPLEYTQTAVVKKNFFKIWGKTTQQYLDTQYIDAQTPSFLNKKINANLQEVNKVKNLPGYDDSWITYNVTSKISPSDMLPFEGKIYLLVDGGTFSASEDFAQVCKRTAFAEIVGNNTGGGAAAFIPPHYFCLPESKIIFRLEVEAVLNPDGTMSEELGTDPDIKMEIKPTPTNYNKESLLQDDWIYRIINY